jgi:hypothetical protein
VDRAQFIYFDPTPLEIHKNTALWFWDQEIFDFIGAHLHVISPDKLSSRSYVKAYERKPKGDWKEFIARRYFAQSGEQWVLAVESDPKCKSVTERVAEFMKRTGLGRSTYFNLKKALISDGWRGERRASIRGSAFSVSESLSPMLLAPRNSLRIKQLRRRKKRARETESATSRPLVFSRLSPPHPTGNCLPWTCRRLH